MENGIRTKLNADFDKRTEQAPNTLDKSRTTYVAVTARRFGQQNKADWVEEKRQLGIWADVRVHDADDLATWLARTPAVACWFATTALGRPATDLTDVETYLRDWSGRGRTHPVPSELLVAGGERRRAMAFVRSALSEPRPRALHVRGETHEEALVFVAAALMASAPDERERWLARTLIVESREAWRWALRSEQAQPLILLPAFADFDLGASATRHAFVIVPEDTRHTGHADVQLDPIPFDAFAQVLIESGVRASDAERLARDSGGKLSAYLTLTGHHAFVPPRHDEEGTQLDLLLVGAWTPSNSLSADKLRGDWPKTAAMLDALAKAYLRDAEQEDAETRSERLKYGWEPEEDHPIPSASLPEPTPTDTVGHGIERLEIQGIASAPAACLEFAPRLNLLAGDNSTGKTLVLDVLWWARTATWAHAMAWPGPVKEGTPGATIRVGSPNTPDVESRFDATREHWSRPANWPTPRALALYARVDGGFSVWDPIRNDTSSTPGRADMLSAYRFTPEALWNGVEEHGKTWCNGLLRDWIDWQYRRTGLFDALKDVLAGLSPSDEPLRPGTPVRVSMHEARDIPTLELSYGTVPVIHASAAVRRILGLAYLLVWSWNEHREAARLAGQPVAEQVLLLIDEVESHLHPKWQRLLLPALLRVIQRLTGEVQVQVVASTHAPLVMASLESHFERERDKVFHFALDQGRIVVEEQPWAMQGDAVGWLVSETFGLKQARSREAEQAIEAAEAYMRHEPLPGHETPEKLQQWLQAVLPGHDPFWPRWLVATGAVR
ncbi:AAA family ATPase [Melittangium boletus]|uniref:AAA family ATPase n=1 Tax=Melittangium boletus TaxID=83453 RepID=UPI003DA63C02